MTKLAQSITLLLFAAILPAFFSTPAAKAAEGRTSALPITQRWVRTAGWEKSLVQGNPNLGHFTWIPITSYPHDMGVVKGPAPGPYRQASRRPNQHFYMKPVHVPTVINQARSAPEAQQPYHPHYVKPVHIPTITGSTPRQSTTGTKISFRTGRQAADSVYGSLKSTPYEEVVSGKRLSSREDRGQAGRLSLPEAEEVVSGRLSPGPQVAVYSDVYGNLQSGNAYGNLESKQVYGRISSPRVRRF